MPIPTTKKEAAKVISRIATGDKDYYCEYGHHGCSDRKNGPCSDEILNRWPDLADPLGQPS